MNFPDFVQLKIPQSSFFQIFLKTWKIVFLDFLTNYIVFEMSHALSSQNDYDLHIVGKGIGNLQLGRRCKFP